MKELEDTNCEIRRIVELQPSIWDRLSAASEDEQSPGSGPNDAFESTKPLGGFLDGSNHAWLSCGNHLIVLNVRTGESVSSWNFRYRISTVSPFPTQAGQLPLLLIGLDNDAHKIKESIGMICIFNCTTSRILRVIRVPCGVEQICVISGGTEWEELCDRKIATIFGSNSGIACVALRNLDYLIIDLQRSSWDNVSPYLVTDELSPYEIEFPNSKGSASTSRRSFNREKHAAYSLINSRIEKYLGFNRETFESMALPEEKLTTSLINSKKLGCLIAGCLGKVMLWQSDGSIGWISPQFDDNMFVSHLALIEPADDPRSFYYLWITCEDESGVAAPVLRMYAMLFEKKSSQEETSFKLESDPSLKFEIELDEGDTISCLLPIERENAMDQCDSGSRRGEESLLLIGTNNRMLLFDLNQWYKEQMPLTASGCSNQNSILASYRTGGEMPNSVRDLIVSTIYVPSSIKEFVNSGPNALEELFFPNSLSFEWIELTASRITFWLTRGVQADLLRKIIIAGPVTLIQPVETFHRCIAAGLIPFNTECSFNCDHNAQREMLLSLCLEQSWASFLVKCAKEWSDGSASYLFPAFLRWGIQRGTSIKIYADQLSVPLFDQSGSNVGEAETKILRFCCQQLECLSTVVNKMNVDSVDFIMQQRALKRVATYFQVLLWFYDVGLLPETEEENKNPYPYQRLMILYREKREKLKAKRNGKEDDNLFIDNLIMRECSPLRLQWEREGVDVASQGQYPPPSLQSLLRSYLADCHQDEIIDLENKHQITYYLLLDLAMVLNDSSKNQLIKYPAAFKLSPSVIKLVQAFWLLDHEDYQGFLDMITGQSILESDIKDWHHQLVVKTLVHDNQHKLALMYLRVRKPPLMTLEEQGTVISLSVEHGLVQSAFHCRPSSHYTQLLMRFFRACKTYGKLPEILHLALDKEEEDAFVRFLEEDKSEETKLLYYLQRSRHSEASSITSSRFAHLNQPVSLDMFKAYNCTLPDITRRFTNNQIKRNTDVDLDMRYLRPMSHAKSYNRSQEIYETVLKKARETFNRGDNRERTQIPFISAPCMSLRTYPPSSDVNCVLFMEKRKHPMKRSIYQMQGNEILEANEKKRIKLDDQCTSREKNKKEKKDKRKSCDKSELGIEALFSTPLVKRKTMFTNPVSTPLETPHSILKIRQLIRESGSPILNVSQNFVTDAISEKKPRQIRFSVSQIHDDSIESSIDKQKVDESKEVIDEESSAVSEDHFFSPNVSARSEESGILTDTSITFARNVGPKPRPGLQRRSNLSNDSRTMSKSASTSSVGTPQSISYSNQSYSNSTGINSAKSSRSRNPHLSSIYSSSVLSDSSFDDFKHLDDKSEWDGEHSEKVTRISKSISFTRVVKTVVEEIEIDDVTEEMNTEINEESDVNESDRIEEASLEEIETQEGNETDEEMQKECDFRKNVNRTIETDEVHNEKFVRDKLTEINGAVMVHEETLDDKSGIHEDTNRNILPEGAMVDRESLSDKELEDESSDDLEMLPLKDEDDEVFESLSNSINTEVHSSSTTEKSISSKGEFFQSGEFSNQDEFSITDDESEIFNQSSSEGDKTIQDDANITDDESDVKEVENQENLRKSNCTNRSEILVNQEKSENSRRKVSLRNTPVRETRARRASSIAKEDIESVSQVSSKVKEEKLQKRSEKTPVRERTRRASSIAKESVSSEVKEDNLQKNVSEVKDNLQKNVSEVKEDNLQKSISKEKTPLRETRARRASSKDESDSRVSSEKEDNLQKRNISKEKTPLRETRARRASSKDESDSRVSSEKEDNLQKRNISKEKTPLRETRARRASSKDESDSRVSSEKEDNLQKRNISKEKTPLRETRTRRASSIAKEDLESDSQVSSKVKEDNLQKRSISREKTPVRETRSQKTSKILASQENVEKAEKEKAEEEKAGKVEKEKAEKVEKSVEKRETRGQRTLAKDSKNVTETSESTEITKVRETRTQKNLPLKKDSMVGQEIVNVEESSSTPRRSRRASSVSRMDKTDGLDAEVEAKEMEKKVRCKTPVRETKGRSSASRNEESLTEEIEGDKKRSKRGSSLVKEILSSTVELGNKKGGRKISSESEGSLEVTPKRGRPKKAQETSSSQEIEKETEETSRVVRRNTRRAASVQKELTCIEEIAPKEQETSVVKPDEEDTAETIKKNTRSRRGNSVSKEISLPRMTRAASVSKEIIEEPTETSLRQTRGRRGTSVPKEISLAPSKTKRPANVTETTINEESINENEESTTNVPLKNKVSTEELSIPVTRKRTRCQSVQSIPEEVEEILNIPTRSKSTRATEKKEILPRSRRAASVDLPVEPKRYTRSTRLKESVIEDIILEESREEEAIRSDSRIIRQPTRRKRAASETITIEERVEPEVKSTVEKPRRGRKVSQKSDDASAEFSFSPPQKTSVPKDKKEISQVHNFVFSPPHTRSKQTSQSRRCKSFIPTLTEEEMQEAALLTAATAEKMSDEKQDNSELTRNPILRFVPNKIAQRKTFNLNKPKKQEK